MVGDRAQLLYCISERLNQQFDGCDLSVFLLRLGVHFERLQQLFERLYGRREDASEHLIDLALALAESYLQRPSELREVDHQREVEPHWYMSPNWVATMLYVDRFANDLQGFKEKIDYLDVLGINYVHLMPLLKMPPAPNDGGYAVSDYRSVDPQLGSMADIREIAAIFREKNMLLELDLVLNHTSDQHEWAQRAMAGDIACQDMYYFYDDRRIPDLFEKTLLEIFPQSAPGNFSFIPSLNKWVYTTFNHFQWDLNYSNPRVLIEMTKVLLYLGNQGVDVIRLDAVAFTWKRLGTQCQNLKEAHWLLQLFKVCARITAPGLLFKAEAIVQPKEIVKYLGDGAADECEIAYNASLMVYLWDAIATKHKLILESGLSNMPRLPQGTTWINYIRCHDDIGLGYADEDILKAGFDPVEHRQFIIDYYVGEYFDSPALGRRFMENPKTGDARITGSAAALLGIEKGINENNQELIDTGIRKLLLLYGLVMSFGGIPMVYYGDEVATGNDYSFQNDASRSDDNRWLNRPIIDWDQIERRKQQGTVEQRVFDALQRMIAVRKTLPEFYNANDYQPIRNNNPQVFTFLRQQDWHRALVIANFSDNPQILPEQVLDHAGFGHYVYDAFTKQTVVVENGGIRLQPYQFFWLKQR